MKKIIVTKRNDDFHAHLEGHKEIWACGKTASEAIGDLITSHPESFKDITIEHK